ncbi:hypothetical protein VAWG004_26350 [Aeromonas veronii]|nr:hypothetical protein VAWG004_26350 [Aeromonas veronii]
MRLFISAGLRGCMAGGVLGLLTLASLVGAEAGSLAQPASNKAEQKARRRQEGKAVISMSIFCWPYRQRRWHCTDKQSGAIVEDCLPQLKPALAASPPLASFYHPTRHPLSAMRNS